MRFHKISLAISLAISLIFLFVFAACSSSSTKEVKEPLWTQQPTRTVDNGYIVFVGKAEDASLERAKFKAEGEALLDLANECSFVPKGARMEDRFEGQAGNVQGLGKIKQILAVRRALR